MRSSGWNVRSSHACVSTTSFFFFFQAEDGIRDHCVTGVQTCALPIYEFFDGSGYPQGLAGSQIPLGARIVAIADAYDTITSERTYKKAHTPEEAFQELERCGAAQFDPELVRAFILRLRDLPNPLIEPILVPEREVLTK